MIELFNYIISLVRDGVEKSRFFSYSLNKKRHAHMHCHFIRYYLIYYLRAFRLCHFMLCHYFGPLERRSL